MAKDMGCLIPEPLCIEDFRSDHARGRRLPDNILLDEVGVIIGDALKSYLGTNVVTATMTDSLRKYYEKGRVKKMIIKNEKYTIATKDYPIKFDDGNGNPVDDLDDAYLELSYDNAKSRLENCFDEPDEFQILKVKVSYEF